MEAESIFDSFMQRMARTMDDEQFARAFSPEGLAPTCDWIAEDEWILSYTTKRIRGGTLAGLFAVFAYEPYGPGSRSGNAMKWRRVKTERCDSRREAKHRAMKLYYEHSPKKAAKHGWNGEGYDRDA